MFIALDQLSAGHEIFSYQMGSGFLGYERMSQEKMPAAEFVVDGSRRLTDVLTRPHVTRRAEVPEQAAHVVGIDWIETVAVADARTFLGIFSNQNVVCKLRHPATVEFLLEEFGVGSDGAAAP